MSVLRENKVAWEHLRVIVVDDNKFFRTLIRTVLRHFGVREVHEAENGKQALDMLSTTQVDFVLLEWNMPVCSGAEFMTKARDQRGRRQLCQAAVIVVTGEPTRKVVKEAAALGVDGILCKPIVPKLLMKRMSEVLDGKGLKNAVTIVDASDAEQGLIDKFSVEKKSVFML